MANHKSAIKKIRSDARKRERNRAYRSATRTNVKKARKAIEEGNTSETLAAVQSALSQLDKAATKGIIHKKNAARRKSRLMASYNKMLVEKSA